MNGLEKIKEIINNSRSFAIVSEKEPAEHILLLREALKNFLQSQGKFARVLPDNSQSFTAKWIDILSEAETSATPQSFSIKIPKDRFDIREISYDDNEQFLYLNIATGNNDFDFKNIEFAPMPAVFDAAFCFSNDSVPLMEFKDKIIVPQKEKIIFITENDTASTEKVHKIIEALGNFSQTAENLSTILLAALLTETKNFTSRMDEKTLKLAALLMEKGADKKFITAILESEKNLSFSQLLGRALARTRISHALASSWTFLSKEDLEKTGGDKNSKEFFPEIISKIKDFIPPQTFYFLFWQNEGQVRLAASAEEHSIGPLLQISEALDGKFLKNHFFAGPYKNFSEAEIKTREALKELAR